MFGTGQQLVEAGTGFEAARDLERRWYRAAQGLIELDQEAVSGGIIR